MTTTYPFIPGAEIEADVANTAISDELSLMPHLELAVRYALADLVYVEDEVPFQRLRQDVLRSALPKTFANVFGAANADTTPGYSPLLTLTDRIAITADGPDVNTIWTSPAFIMPAVAALAQLFERSLHPTGDSRMTLYLRPEQDSLYGYRIIDVRAWGIAMSSEGEEAITAPSALDKRELCAHLTGAAYFFLRGYSGVNIGSRYLKFLASKSPGTGRLTSMAEDGNYAVLV